MNKKGQSVLAEHVMVFFVVVAALVAMSTFVQRGLKAKIHDARNFMIDSVVNSGACDANCLAATGSANIAYEYEPYYSQTVTLATKNDNDFKGRTSGKAAAIGVIYNSIMNDETQRATSSEQLPAACAGYPNGGCPFQQ